MAHYPLALAGVVLEPTPTVYRGANVLYLAVLLASVYRVGVRLRSPAAGLLAAVLVSLMPAIYGHLRVVGLDFPAACLTAAAAAALLASEHLGRLSMAAAFGALAGVAVLAKAQAALFLFWPAAALVVLGVVRAARARDRRALLTVLAGAALAVALTLLVTSPYWWGRVERLWSNMASHTTGEGMLHYEGDISLLGGVRFYLTRMPYLVGGVFSVTLAPLVWAFWRGARGNRLAMLAWLVVPLVLHMVLKLRNTRYLLPLVPAAALVVSVGLVSLGPKLARVLPLAAMGVSALLWLTCSFAGSPCSASR